jgi:hypothetical protein
MDFDPIAGFLTQSSFSINHLKKIMDFGKSMSQAGGTLSFPTQSFLDFKIKIAKERGFGKIHVPEL